jgi:hypothetical protein
MPPRDQDCCRNGACREDVLDLLFEGRFPSERHVEMLLDRLERERWDTGENRAEAPR